MAKKMTLILWIPAVNLSECVHIPECHLCLKSDLQMGLLPSSQTHCKKMNTFLFCLASPSVFQPNWPLLPFSPTGFCLVFPAVVCFVLGCLHGFTSKDLTGVCLCPFHHLSGDQNSVLWFISFLPPIFFAFAVFHVAALNYCTDHPERGGEQSFCVLMQNRRKSLRQDTENPWVACFWGL